MYLYIYVCVGVFQTDEFALSNDLQAGSGPNKKQYDMHQFPECFQNK